jgi:hypothetical protein
MKAEVIDEPSLEFAGSARHLDCRFGIAEYGPADLGTPGAPTAIRVALLGDRRSIDGLSRWLEACRQPIDAKQEDRPGLWPQFPGFSADAGYQTELILDPRLQREIKEAELTRLESLRPDKRVPHAQQLYLEELEALVQQGRPDVVICDIPDVLQDVDAPVSRQEGEEGAPNGSVSSPAPPAFHDVLKAGAMRFRVPLQLVRGSTYDSSRIGRQRRRSWKPRGREDEATIAWNFFTALYYKARGTPWRMVRTSTELDSCFVGVAFYQSVDRLSTATSVAQVYNERGDGVVVRGGPAKRSSRDRQLHLSRDDAAAVLINALETYKAEHRHVPARIVVHKTSAFDEREREGMLAAAADLHIDACELIWVTTPTARLYREGYHPPRRGTFLALAEDECLLYTRGSVEWYETYPGMYVPNPIALRGAVLERSILDVAEEVMALSKMNWNSTRFDGRLPVSLRTARQVADIIKHLEPDAYVEPTYAYYM